ncbi:MAG: right-handed parallel beta-helix repeat-containing protein [Sphingomonas sp.]|uniref:right-handed parallel beta-helix repeat-containing protein n=1 Tax=Sphingomonas sp. TaxID=28214 RepID=UPI001B2E7336|nr:right-handed parallel beta-helix repeat-containing protein [Sphingomonas sp.]MBO9621124.1 right-handed parallel beta-helix repeat-containing protein [Sphingomonas sp.]
MRPLALLLALAAPAAAEPQPAPFVIAETGQGFATIDDAVTAVRDGTATILIAPGVYRQCTVQTGGRITYKAVEPGKAIFEREACEGKAGFVLRGRGSAIDGVVFRNYSVSDGNGAGVRIEMGDLTVTNSMFLDSQEGILGGGHETVRRITIDRSTFSGLGQCDETVDCSHSIYLAVDGDVTITRSRFERGTGGHYVKLRARRVNITDSSFDDSAGRKTNYMIDLCEGGTGLIARNVFVQGRAKENHSGLIVIAAESRTYPSNGLRVEENTATLAPGAPTNPAFVADLSGSAIALRDNRLGPGIRAFERR